MNLELINKGELTNETRTAWIKTETWDCIIIGYVGIFCILWWMAIVGFEVK